MFVYDYIPHMIKKTAKNLQLWLFIITYFNFNIIICGHQFYAF